MSYSAIGPYIWMNLEDVKEGFEFASIQNQLVQKLRQHDYRCCGGFASWALKQLTQDPFFFVIKLIFFVSL